MVPQAEGSDTSLQTCEVLWRDGCEVITDRLFSKALCLQDSGGLADCVLTFRLLLGHIPAQTMIILSNKCFVTEEFSRD